MNNMEDKVGRRMRIRGVISKIERALEDLKRNPGAVMADCIIQGEKLFLLIPGSFVKSSLRKDRHHFEKELAELEAVNEGNTF